MVQVIDVTELNIFSKKKAKTKSNRDFGLNLFVKEMKPRIEIVSIGRMKLSTLQLNREHMQCSYQIDIFFLFGLCLFPSESR